MIASEHARREMAPVFKRTLSIALVVGLAGFSAGCSTYSSSGPQANLADGRVATAEATTIQYDAAGNEIASSEGYVNPRATQSASWGRYSGAAGQEAAPYQERYEYRGKQALGGPQ